jgi:hypothetical protein
VCDVGVHARGVISLMVWAGAASVLSRSDKDCLLIIGAKETPGSSYSGASCRGKSLDASDVTSEAQLSEANILCLQFIGILCQWRSFTLRSKVGSKLACFCSSANHLRLNQITWAT